MEFVAPAMNLRYGSGTEALKETRDAFVKDRTSDVVLPTFDEIVSKYPTFAGATSTFASGSVIQGWAHANSDLDMYVVTEDAVTVDDSFEFFERSVSCEVPAIKIVIGQFDAFRSDIELWRTSQIDEIIGRYAGKTPSQDAPELGKREQDILYRLSVGKPIQGEAWWTERKAAIHASCYGNWMAENRKLIAETYLEDAGGLLISGDHETAVLAVYEAFTGSVEALLALYGDYCVNRKWLQRRVVDFAPAEITAAEAWSLFSMQGLHESPEAWVRNAARVSQRLLAAVERKTA
ncbi:hypothetical protein ACQKM2_07265 [Streptomyces sp. NPDC004126]|uniref:hypothetical protein n=1 Tax=Streptomyces sp. NPDC004126 TaxID=3390695 RepID=UPI003D04BB7E